MNIFVVDFDAATAASMLADKHVVKMILESCQLLSTAHHVLDGTHTIIDNGNRRYNTYVCNKQNICKAAMINHPCNVWARATKANYMWLWRHAYALCKEYTRRYGKVHAMESMLLNELYDAPKNIAKEKLTPFAQAMPEQYHDSNAVVAYRRYYINDKAKIAKWKHGYEPDWFKLKVAEVFDEPVPF